MPHFMAVYLNLSLVQNKHYRKEKKRHILKTEKLIYRHFFLFIYHFYVLKCNK